MVTLADARQHLGIDESDDTLVNANISRALSSAEAMMRGAVGDDARELMGDDPRVDALVLAYTTDIYNERSTVSSKVTASRNAWIFSMEEQLRLELRIKRRESE